jgi:cytidylate kinase
VSGRALRLVILGRQGSGKGTQCLRLVEHYGTLHVSTGDMLRAAVADGSELGKKAEAIMNSGGLVSDEIMNGIVAERLAKPDIKKRACSSTVSPALSSKPRRSSAFSARGASMPPSTSTSRSRW